MTTNNTLLIFAISLPFWIMAAAWIHGKWRRRYDP